MKESMNVFRVSHSITSKEKITKNWIFSLKFFTKCQDKYIKCISYATTEANILYDILTMYMNSLYILESFWDWVFGSIELGMDF